MKTKKLNTNKTMRAGMIFAVIAIITFVALIITFAKYATQNTSEDNARVARWGINKSIPTDLDLFDASYSGTDGKTTVDSSDRTNVIAPGTSKLQTINLASFTDDQPPEVMYHFEPTLTIVDQSTTSSQTISLIEKLNENKAFTWTLVDASGVEHSYQTYQELQNAVASLGEKDIAPNHFPTCFNTGTNAKIKIGWNWDYEINGNANDASDTLMGDLATNETLTGLKTTLTLNAYQCQGCKPSKKDPEVIEDPNMPSEGSVNDLYIDGSGIKTFAKTISDGNPITTSSDNTIAETSAIIETTNSDNKTIRYTVTPRSVGSSEITLGVEETENYYGFQRMFYVNVIQKIDEPEAKKDLIYNKSSQIGVASGKGYVLSVDEETGASIDSNGNAVATNAGNYSATAKLEDGYVWADGSKDDKIIIWSIAKTNNPAKFVLDQSEFNTDYNNKEDVSIRFTAVKDAPEGSTIKYDASSSASSPNNFYIPEPKTSNILVCAKETGLDTYNITLTAQVSESTNYYASDILTQSCVWTVTNQKSSIQSEIDDTIVNFLPAYSGEVCPYKFYTKNGNNYTEIKNIGNMGDLATKIKNAGGADKIYTNAQNVTFYGTINKAWNETFVAGEDYKATGLQESFKDSLPDGVSTVYEFGTDNPWDTASGTPQLASDTEKKDVVNYGTTSISSTEFYGAYGKTSEGGFLSSEAYAPFSSFAKKITPEKANPSAFYWYVYNHYWSYEGLSEIHAIVLSRTF